MLGRIYQVECEVLITIYVIKTKKIIPSTPRTSTLFYHTCSSQHKIVKSLQLHITSRKKNAIVLKFRQIYLFPFHLTLDRLQPQQPLAVASDVRSLAIDAICSPLLLGCAAAPSHPCSTRRGPQPSSPCPSSAWSWAPGQPPQPATLGCSVRGAWFFF